MTSAGAFDSFLNFFFGFQNMILSGMDCVEGGKKQTGQLLSQEKGKWESGHGLESALTCEFS